MSDNLVVSEVVVEKKPVGRPKKYTGALLDHMLAAIAAVGLTKASKLFGNVGAVRKSFEKKFGFTVDRELVHGSMKIPASYLCKLNQQNGGAALKRGRPRKAA